MRIGALLPENAKSRTTIPMTASVVEAADRMGQPHLRALVVIDGERPIGIVTRRDLFERVIARQLSPATSISDVMSADPITASSDLAVEDAVALMTRNNIRHLAILDPDGQLEGVLGIEMLISWLVADREARVDDLLYYITHG